MNAKNRLVVEQFRANNGVVSVVPPRGPVLLLHVTELGYPEPEAAVLVGVLFSVLAVCAALGNQLAAALLTRGTTRAVIVGSLLVASGALAAFALVRSAWSMTITIAAFGAAIGTALTTTFTTAGSVVPRTAHGLVSVFSRVRR